MVYLKTLRQLMGYLLIAAAFLYSYIGVYYLICALGSFMGYKYCLRQWLALDIIVCTIIHGTFRRTISGYTGQRMHLKRYKLQASVIDTLAKLFGDDKDHCLRAYGWEKRNLDLDN